MPLDLAFLHCNLDPHCVARVDKYFEGYSTLQFVDRGAVEVFYDGVRYEMRATDWDSDENNEPVAWFWPAFPGPHIRFNLTRDAHQWRHRYAAFTGERLQSWKHAGIWLAQPQRAPRPIENAAKFDEILSLIWAGDNWSRRRAAHELEGLLLELAQHRAQEMPHEAWLRDTRHFLATSREFSPDYAKLARKLGMGLSTLRRKFSAATGSSLHEALMRNRLDAARRLLGETDLPLKHIAAELGYQNAYFFSNQFKELAGVTPSAYRKSRQS